MGVGYVTEARVRGDTFGNHVPHNCHSTEALSLCTKASDVARRDVPTGHCVRLYLVVNLGRGLRQEVLDVDKLGSGPSSSSSH